MKKVLFIVSSVLLFVVIVYMMIIVNKKLNNYIYLKAQYQNAVGLNSELNIKQDNYTILLKNSEKKKEILDKKTVQYNELEKKNKELKNSLNDTKAKIINYNNLITDIQNKINKLQ